MGSVSLLIVACKMLRAGGNARFLNAPDDCGGDSARKERILGEIFKIPAAERISVNIHSGSKQNIRADLFHLLADFFIEFFGKGAVPCAG